ncbi:MAG: hypothetical protein FNT29_06045 [Halothiobacillaceae bacterium]|nr:MAG: hypothetical protein FNT29_06045 [Halothiobacillaceae bacterium]
MTRLSIAKAAQSIVPRDRDGVWRVIRELRSFSLPELRGYVRMSERALGQFVNGLVAAGYLEPHIHGDYRLINDPGADAPRVREDGSIVTRGLKAERLWRTARILGEFSVRELWQSACADDCCIKGSYAHGYVAAMHRAGYLVMSSSGGGGRATRYRMIKTRYSGPKAPVIQRRGAVYDPNTRRVVWSPEGGEA